MLAIDHMTLFVGKYRVESARLKGWDYSSKGYYFVTICTGNRRHYFGKIVNGKMALSEMGQIIQDEWQKTGMIRKNVKLDEFVVMPNHIHGILVIESIVVETPRRGVSTNDLPRSTNDLPPSANNPVFPRDNNNWGPNTLGSIINQFKSVSTKRIRAMGGNNFEWQGRYHDHIIRNQWSLDRIRRYIENNPRNWQNDRMNN
ncbi:MAG: transposase [Candidatus Margulisiibacteriota bacterium]